LSGGLRVRAGVRAGRTVLLEVASVYPIQVARPQTLPDGCGLSLLVLMLSGGLLDGDEVGLEVELEAGARLALRTQAATQVHRGRSAQRLQVRVGPGAVFSYVPQALVPHAGADHHARVEVELAPTARALIAEHVGPGRTAYGEAFAYTSVRLDLDVHATGHLVARERVRLEPDSTLRPAQLGPATHVATAYVLTAADGEDGDDGEWVRAALGAGGLDAGNALGPWAGVSALADGGWLVRALGIRAADLDALLARLAAAWWTR
jgi:urease accessory protein